MCDGVTMISHYPNPKSPKIKVKEKKRKEEKIK